MGAHSHTPDCYAHGCRFGFNTSSDYQLPVEDIARGAEAMTEAPDRIWVQYHKYTDGTYAIDALLPESERMGEWTEYTRAQRIESLEAENARLKRLIYIEPAMGTHIESLEAENSALLETCQFFWGAQYKGYYLVCVAPGWRRWVMKHIAQIL